MKIKFIVLSGWLLLTAASSTAMSLGRHSGATLIGRPLDISVQAVLEAQDDAGNLCLEADVFYADNKLDKSRVRVTLEKSATVPTQAVIRIRSASLIDEPVVSVYLRAGCQLKTERRYVSLAELVTEAAPDRTASAVPAAVPVRPTLVPSINAGTSVAELAGVQPPKPKRTRTKASASATLAEAGNPNTADAAPVAQLKAQDQIPKPKAQRTPAAAKARLKLEPLDLTIERDPQLKSSAELLSMPAANPQERAAASALWRALSAQPQDILRDTEKLEALENSVRSLQTQSQKTLLSIDDLHLKLQQAQSERYANALVYSLLAVLLAALASLAYLLRHRFIRQRRLSGDKPWWRKNEAYESQKAAWVDSFPLEDQHELAAEHFTAAQKSALVDVNVDFDLDPASSKSGGLRPIPSSNFVDSVPYESKDKSGFGPSLMHPTRAVKAEELFDVQQQADFFVSIGQHDQAIDLLRSHIAESLDTSAVVYLDLFNLYHQLKRPAEYDNLRLVFNQRFNTQVPTFELYTDKNLGLEAYEQAMSRIAALWPSPKVLEIIEESLFRRPDTSAEAFNLEAYRELLMLYSVAKEIISPEPKTAVPDKKFDLPESPADSANSRPMTFMSTAIQPLSAVMVAYRQTGHGFLEEPLTPSTVPPVSRRLGLDIDLTEFTNLTESVQNKHTGKSPDDLLFVDFDIDAELPVLGADAMKPIQSATNTDNLIDFEAFDLPVANSEKRQLPKV